MTTPARLLNLSRRRRRPGARRRAFTLVEMLAVMGIIMVLVAILLPVISRVRGKAHETDTLASMQTISAAIESYRLDFGAYPGPLSNTAITTGVASIGGNLTEPENLVLGLCGGWEIGGTVIANIDQIGLGPISHNPNPARQSRTKAYIDPSPGTRMPPQSWNTNGRTGVSDSYVPEFVDRFPVTDAHPNGRAILYLRSRVGNAGVTSPDDTTQYNYNHLLAYQSPPDPANPSNTGDFAFGTGTNPNTNTDYYLSWANYLANPNNTATARGQDKYILISAGLDGVYGTKDDLFYSGN